MKTISKQKSEKIINSCMKQFGLSMKMKTDPKLIKEILKEIKMDDFKTTHPFLKKYLKEITQKPQPLEFFFDDIKQGLIKKHPAIIEFLEIALKNNWLKNSKEVIKSVHIAFILEIETTAMVNNRLIYAEIYKHLLNKRKKYGFKTHGLIETFKITWQRTNSFFDAMKIVSIDAPITYYKTQRENSGIPLTKKYIRELYKKNKINSLEKKIMLLGSQKSKDDYLHWLEMNIYEASITEYKKGLKSNALVGHILSTVSKKEIDKDFLMQKFVTGNPFPENSQNKIYNLLTEKNNFYLVNKFNQDWVSLYNTWNLAFITGELENLHVLLPKLLIPSVINVKDEDYLMNRVFSLWLSINNFLFIELDKKNKILGPKNKKEMAQVWGKINERYAINLLKNYREISLEEARITFKKMFKKPYFNLFKKIYLLLR